MSGGQAREKDISVGRDDLLSALVQCRERARVGRENKKRAAELYGELKLYEEKSKTLKECINYIVKEYKSIEQYLIDKKEYSMEMLKLAIEKAGMVVPDADAAGIKLDVADRSARVLNERGQDINLREGSAFRTVMGVLMRYTLLKAQPDAIQMILLDEAFSTLSEATAATMRDYLEAFREDMLIVGIEQRNYLYDGLERDVYEVVKEEDKVSTVRRVKQC